MPYADIVDDGNGTVTARHIPKVYNEDELIRACNHAVYQSERQWMDVAGAMYSLLQMGHLDGLLSEYSREFLKKKGLWLVK
jgi:hypothetical protein